MRCRSTTWLPPLHTLGSEPPLQAVVSIIFAPPFLTRLPAYTMLASSSTIRLPSSRLQTINPTITSSFLASHGHETKYVRRRRTGDTFDGRQSMVAQGLARLAPGLACAWPELLAWTQGQLATEWPSVWRGVPARARTRFDDALWRVSLRRRRGPEAQAGGLGRRPASMCLSSCPLSPLSCPPSKRAQISLRKMRV